MPERVRRFVFPREGWLSWVLIMVMLLALGWSVQRAGWFEPIGFVIPIAYLAALTGAILGLTRLSVVIVLPVSAIIGMWVVLWTVGGDFLPTLDQTSRLLVLRGEALDWGRIVFEGGFAPQLSPYALGLGILMWVTAFMATYALYRHHRVLDSILLVGVTLVANMSATLANPELLFLFLLLFSLAALLLWLRVALISREEGWRTRTVTETLDVPGQIVRSGVTFIFGSIALAWILTTVAVAAPLTGVWSNLDGIWSTVRDQFEGAFGGLSGADSRIQGTSFGASLLVRGKWDSSDQAVMTVAAQGAYYMRTVSYDIYTGHGWTSSKGSDRRVAAGDRIFPGYTPERPLSADSFKVETVTVEIQAGVARNVFTPGYPTAAFIPLVIAQPGGRPLLGALQSGVVLDTGKGYQITADITTATEAMLAGAGTNYPPEIVATYLSTTGVTDRTAKLARQVVDAAGATDPYHEAKALADYLHNDPSFTYVTVGTLPPPGSSQDLVDFFLFDPHGRRGYCEYYASAMAVMARTLGLPSRVTVGYAPGAQIKTGVYQYRRRNAHAWTEIYFPGYGWQSFEATHSIAGITRAPGAGTLPPVPPSAGGDPTRPDFEGKNLGELSGLPSFEPVPGGFTAGGQRPTDETRNNNATILIAFLGLLVLYGTWRVMRIRYRYRFLAPGDREWQRLAFAGDRAGIAQRPAETFYEYASWLEQQLPARQAEIHQIADGKVWQSYSGRSISAEAIARLKQAWGKLQLPMLWLALRSRARALLRGGRT